MKTVTHTSDRKGKFKDTSNVNFQQKLLSNRTLPTVVPTMDPRIDYRIETVGGSSQTLLIPATKEAVEVAAYGSPWIDQTLRQVIQTGVSRSTPGDTGSAIRSKPATSQFLIGNPTISPAFGIIRILQNGKKQQSTSTKEVRNAQTLDTVVDEKLPDDQDYASFFSKVIGRKLSQGSRDDLYSRFRMNFSSNVVQTEAPHFVDLGLLAINILNESGDLGTPATRIRSSVDGSH